MEVRRRLGLRNNLDCRKAFHPSAGWVPRRWVVCLRALRLTLFPSEAMHLHESVDDGIHVFHLRGEIDLHYAPVLRSLLSARVKAHCAALVLDMREVEFIDSTGLAVLIQYHRDCTKYGGKFCLAGLRGHVQHVLEIVRLDKMVPIFVEVDEAKAAIRAAASPADKAVTTG